MRRTASPAAMIIAVLSCAMPMAAGAAAPPATWEGLELRKTKGIDVLYVLPGVEFKEYRNVMLDPVEVSFAKNWNGGRSSSSPTARISNDDLQRMREGMSTQFREVFAEQLAAAGYDVVPKPLDDTLRVSAALVDVYVAAPDVRMAGRSVVYTTNAGHMTLVMELRDGPTGQLLARVVDRHEANDTGFPQATNSVTNSVEFRRGVTAWAKRLVAALDKLGGRAK